MGLLSLLFVCRYFPAAKRLAAITPLATLPVWERQRRVMPLPRPGWITSMNVKIKKLRPNQKRFKGVSERIIRSCARMSLIFEVALVIAPFYVSFVSIVDFVFCFFILFMFRFGIILFDQQRSVRAVPGYCFVIVCVPWGRTKFLYSCIQNWPQAVRLALVAVVISRSVRGSISARRLLTSHWPVVAGNTRMPPPPIVVRLVWTKAIVLPHGH